MQNNSQYERFINIIVNSKDKRVKPFSPSFDDSILKHIKNKVIKEESLNRDFEHLYDNFVSVSKIMNRIYNDVFATIKEIVVYTGTPAFDLISHLVALVNCNYYSIAKKLNQQLPDNKGKVQPYYVLAAAKLESLDKEVGLLPIDSSLEMEIDILSMLINYIRYFRDVKFEHSPVTGIEYVEAVKCMFFNMNGLCALKTDYDDSILNEGYFRFDDEPKTLHFDYFNHNNLKLLQAGVLVLNQKVMHETNKDLKHDLFGRCFTGKRIKKMEVVDGKIELKFSCGKNIYLEEKSKSFAASISGYYDYLKNEKLPKFDNATVLEAISVWVLIQALAEYVHNNFKWDFDIVSKSDFDRVPCRIRKKMLMDYIDAFSSLSIVKIKKILPAFVSIPDAFCDMWNEPLYDCGEYYAFPLFSISQGVGFNIIDSIIQKGGIDLQERGPIFETFIASEMSKAHQSGYKRDVFGSKKYERNGGDYQEIDCIIELKDLVIVAELKCTHYPMNPLNHHDCWDRLKGGCNQAAKKAKYVQDNPKLFQKLSNTISGKPVLPVVVTNYPNYTGYSHNGVYIIDSHTFTSYLNTGIVTANVASKEKGNQVIGIIKLYNSEEEFATNITNYLCENPLVKLFKNNIQIREMTHPEIYGIKTKVLYATQEVPGGPIIHNEYEFMTKEVKISE